MTDDSSSASQDKTWLDKLAQTFSSGPKTRDDLFVALREAHKNQVIDSEVLETIEGALKVADQQAREIMVPRSKMVVLNQDINAEELLKLVIESGHSRFPVFGDSAEDIKGILLAKDLLPLLLKGTDGFSLKEIIRPATIIPESKRLNVLLREFREHRYHMAIVVDEYGSVAGLVTIEDILEEIVGDIEDETDEEEITPIRSGENGAWLVEALTPIEDFNEFFQTGLPDDDFDTIGGLVINAFGCLPNIGEEVRVDQFTFKIIAGNKRKLQLLEMTRNQTAQERS